MDSSVVVTVPSLDCVTVFSFDLAVPSLLTVARLVWEISWAHPTSRNDNAKADVATHITTIRFIIICFIWKYCLAAHVPLCSVIPCSAQSARSRKRQNSTSAPPLTTYGATLIKRGKDCGEPEKCSEVRCGPRGFAKCNGGSARCKILLAATCTLQSS